MPNDGTVIEITEPIEVAIVGDRVQFTCVSGQKRHTYSASFHKCRNGCHIALALLDQAEGAGRKRLANLRPPKPGSEQSAHD